MKRTGFRFGLPMVLLMAWVVIFAVPVQRAMTEDAKEDKVFHIKTVEEEGIGNQPIISVEELAKHITGVELITGATNEVLKNQVVGYRIDERTAEKKGYTLTFEDMLGTSKKVVPAVPINLIAIVSDPAVKRHKLAEQVKYCGVDNARYEVSLQIAGHQKKLIEAMTRHTYLTVGGKNAKIQSNVTDVTLTFVNEPAASAVSQK